MIGFVTSGLKVAAHLVFGRIQRLSNPPFHDGTVFNGPRAEAGANLVGRGIESFGGLLGFVLEQSGLLLAGLFQSGDTDTQ
jgi:hypothetical protein